MREFQPLRVQQHPVHAAHAEDAVVAAVAVAGVADQVVRQVLEMATDLAETPGLRPRAQQRVARGREARRRLVEFHRRQPFEVRDRRLRSEEHTSELQSLMRISYAVFCLKKKKLRTKQAQQSNNQQL